MADPEDTLDKLADEMDTEAKATTTTSPGMLRSNTLDRAAQIKILEEINQQRANAARPSVTANRVGLDS